MQLPTKMEQASVDVTTATEIPSLLKEAVLTSNAMLLAGQDCWLARVKDLFGKAGFVSSFGLHGCEREVIEQVMLRYRDHYVQNWSSEIQRTTSKRGSAGNKLRTYKLFKTEFHLESSLSHIKITKYRVALTRLRVSCHSL